MTPILRCLATAGIAFACMSIFPQWNQASTIESGLVSLQVTHQAFDPARPWNKHRDRVISGNAIVVDGRRLLTTADMVKNAKLIVVRKFGRFPDFKANLVLVDYELNLAMLAVPDEEFWTDLAPLPISKKILQTGRFSINRWRPNGNLEQGSGEVVEYRVGGTRFGSMDLPALNGTASMTGLGWAELLTHDDTVIGLITGHNGREVLGVTGDTIGRFVRASQQQPYRAFAHRGFGWQQLNNDSLKGYFGLKRSDPGVLIRTIYAGGTGHDALRPGDILTKLGPYVIDPEGEIDHPRYGSIRFTLAINDTDEEFLSAEVIRDGETMQLQLKRLRFSSDVYRIHPYLFDRPIDYEVFGGLVVQELSLGYLKRWGKNWQRDAPIRLLIEQRLASIRRKSEPKEKVLIISRALADPVNLGYALNNVIVSKFNGETITGLSSFRDAIKNSTGEFHVIQILSGSGPRRIVYQASEIEAADDRIRETYGIPPRDRPGS